MYNSSEWKIQRSITRCSRVNNMIISYQYLWNKNGSIVITIFSNKKEGIVITIFSNKKGGKIITIFSNQK